MIGRTSTITTTSSHVDAIESQGLTQLGSLDTIRGAGRGLNNGWTCAMRIACSAIFLLDMMEEVKP